MQEKQDGKDTTRFDDETVATIDELLEYRCITSTQHKINFDWSYSKIKVQFNTKIYILIDLFSSVSVIKLLTVQPQWIL